MVKKSRTLIFLIILFGCLLLAGIAEAQGGSLPGFFTGVAGQVKIWAESLAGVAFGFCAILIATSGGNPGRLAHAKEALAYIAVGLLVVEIGVGFATEGTTLTLPIIATTLGRIAALAGGIYLAYGIFELATSGGDPGKMDDAKTAIMWGVIGVAVGGATFTVTTAAAAAEEIVKIFGAAAVGMGAVSFSLGVYKIATSGGAPQALSEGKTNIIWGIVGIAIGTTLWTVAQQFM